MLDRIKRSWRRPEATIEITLNHPQQPVMTALTLGAGASIATGQHADPTGHPPAKRVL